MKIEVSKSERDWIVSSLEHYIDTCKEQITETNNEAWKGILQLAIDNRQGLIDKLNKAGKRKTAPVR